MMALSPREIDALRLVAQGCSYAEVARRLGISRHTAAGYLKSAYRKLDVRSGPAAIMCAVRLGLLGDAVQVPLTR
jgi:DNA-binding CsgD family transcriptional regulator